ncbi:MAG TPA: glycogen/starch synthase [Acidimicrobiia bacterium]|nr:glycogen/starch synthase [Acidimicrobiia bacterium]
MKILFLSSEVVPWSKTGGLADVSGALPQSLRALDHKVLTITPRYDSIDLDGLSPEPSLGGKPVRLGAGTWKWRVFSDRATSTLFVDVPGIFDRGALYTDGPDEHLRWVLFQRLALEVTIAAGFKPKVIHCNDWQTGLVPLLTRTQYMEMSDVPTLMTIHNLGYQGRFSADTAKDLGLDDLTLLHQDHLTEGWYSFLETGLLHADWISTVSPTYAREIQTAEGGAGMDQILRQRADRVVGILNGIDTAEWNPRTDLLIPWRYSSRSLWRKERDKEALLGELGLRYRPQVPVVGVISRMAHQKGFDIMGAPLVHFLETWDVRLTVLGSGEERYESFFGWLRAMNPDSVGFVNSYDNQMAHLIEAGADLFLMPSLYEPCGLNQMYSLAYGTLPVVRRVGGLADTVEQVDGDAGTGFVFDHYTEDGLGWAIGQGLALHQDKPAWQAAQTRGMTIDNSWEARADDYVTLYRRMRKG